MRIRILVLFVLIMMVNTAKACDSTILALIAGEDLNASTVSKFLSISEKLEKEGDMLNAYDIANAKQIHKEIMQNWLKLVVELGSAPMVPDNYKKEFSSILSEVAKDLGRVRKKLETNNLVNIHEIIEGSVTKISILGAQINNKPQIYNFLQLELLVYKPGMYLDEPDVFLDRKEFKDLECLVSNQKNNYTEKMNKPVSDFISNIKNHIETAKRVKNKKIEFDKICITYNDLKNSFVKMKQQLLDEGYFK